MPATWTTEEIELVAERAYQLHLQGKHSDAVILFEGLLAIDPRNLYCLRSLASLSLKLGSADKALGYANRALEVSPKQVEALACRCEANVVLNRLAAAREDLASIEQLHAAAFAARLALRIAAAEKFSSGFLPDATSDKIDR